MLPYLTAFSTLTGFDRAALELLLLLSIAVAVWYFSGQNLLGLLVASPSATRLDSGVLFQPFYLMIGMLVSFLIFYPKVLLGKIVQRIMMRSTLRV
jgi:hypothetical protein